MISLNGILQIKNKKEVDLFAYMHKDVLIMLGDKKNSLSVLSGLTYAEISTLRYLLSLWLKAYQLNVHGKSGQISLNGLENGSEAISDTLPL